MQKVHWKKCVIIVRIFLVTFARIHDLTKHLRSEHVSSNCKGMESDAVVWWKWTSCPFQTVHGITCNI